MSGKALLDHFSVLEDPRQSGKVVYALPQIMMLVLCATLAAAEDVVEVRHWGEEKLAFLRTMLPFAHGIPSHDALNDVLNALAPDLFSNCFTTWVEALREAEPDIVAVDGKLDHGRGEPRRRVVCHDIDRLVSDRRDPGEPRFPGLKAIAMAEATVGRGEKTSVKRRDFLSSLPLDAGLFARAVRAHGDIENRLHWVLDVVSHDDLMRLRTAHEPKNMATIKHMAMNLIRSASGKDQPQDPSESRSLESRLPQGHRHADRMKPFERLPCFAPTMALRAASG